MSRSVSVGHSGIAHSGLSAASGGVAHSGVSAGHMEERSSSSVSLGGFAAQVRVC